MQAYADEGHFASGSMGPKVDAVCRFVQGTDCPGVITSLDEIVDAVTLLGATGTVVVADET
jgi:carbamate kinase